MRRVVFHGGAVPALVLGAAFAATAQEPAGEFPMARVAVIDMNEISSESALGKSYAKRIEELEKEIQELGAQKQSELEKLDAQIKAIQDDLEKQANVLSPEGRDKKLLEIKAKQRERQGFLEDGQLEIQRLQERARQQAQSLNNEFQVKVRPHVESVAREKGVDVLLDSQAALAVTERFDISKDVIVRLDQVEKPAAAAAPGSGGN